MPELEFQAPGAVTTWFRDKRTKLLECFAEKRSCRPPETVHAAWRGVLAQELMREPCGPVGGVERGPRWCASAVLNDVLVERRWPLLLFEPSVQILENLRSNLRRLVALLGKRLLDERLHFPVCARSLDAL